MLMILNEKAFISLSNDVEYVIPVTKKLWQFHIRKSLQDNTIFIIIHENPEYIIPDKFWI